MKSLASNVNVKSIRYDFENPDQDKLETGSKFYLYTNSSNLRLFLSSGLIHPKFPDNELHFKDLSTFNSKGVVLFKNIVSINTLNQVKEKSYNYPVCLEIIINESVKNSFVFDEQYLARPIDSPELLDSDIAIFIPGMISFSAVKNIYFASDRELDIFNSDKHIAPNINFQIFSFSVNEKYFNGAVYDGLIINSLSDSINLENSISSNKFILFNKVSSLLLTYKFSILKDYSSKLILDYIKLASFMSEAVDAGSLKNVYKNLKKEDLDYEDFNFSSSFLLLVPIIAKNYNLGELKVDFENFVNDFGGKKKNADELIQTLLNYLVIRTVLNWDPSSSDSEFYFRQFKQNFENLVGNTKKNKKSLDKILSVFEDAEKVFLLEKDLTVITEWDSNFKSLSYFMILCFNLGMENIIEYMNHHKKLGFEDFLWLFSLAGLQSGYHSFHSDYKLYQKHDMKIMDGLLYSWSLGSNLNNLLPKLIFDQKIKNDPERIVISEKVILPIGCTINIQSEQKVEKKNIFDLIIGGIVPKDNSLFVPLSKHFGWDDLVYSEIRFDLQRSFIDFKSNDENKTASGRLIVKGKNPFSIKEIVKNEEFINRLKIKINELSIDKIPADLTKSINDYYMNEAKQN